MSRSVCFYSSQFLVLASHELTHNRLTLHWGLGSSHAFLHLTTQRLASKPVSKSTVRFTFVQRVRGEGCSHLESSL